MTHEVSWISVKNKGGFDADIWHCQQVKVDINNLDMNDNK